MEYLMTYGWAILIIAVVLGALYSLGLFNANTLGPRAAPGSCQVYRPNGPMSTQYISLEGICNTESPQYVAVFNNASQSDQIQINDNPAMDSIFSPNGFTVSFWGYFQPVTASFAGYTIMQKYNYNTNGFEFSVGAGGPINYISSSNIRMVTTTANAFGGGIAYPTTNLFRTWGFYTFVFSYNGIGTNVSQYFDGAVVGNLPIGTGYPLVNNLPFIISGPHPTGGATPSYINGLMSDIQLYNSSIDANSVKALYQEGLGGAPINLQTLVAWWPLDGNANDYSGNQNNGQPTNVIYTTQWQNGYVSP